MHKNTGLLIIGGLFLLGGGLSKLTSATPVSSSYTTSGTTSTTPNTPTPTTPIGNTGLSFGVGSHVVWNGVDSNGYGNGDGYVIGINGNTVTIKYVNPINASKINGVVVSGQYTSYINVGQVSGVM